MRVVCTYFLLFFIYSFLGWILEVSCKFISDKKFVNRGFLIGPYCPIYGFGAVLMTILLQKYLDDPLTLFIMILLVCSFLEYLTSYFMEKIFKTRWWDYSNKRFNINGRICLETMVPFGLFGLFIMYITNPLFLSFLEKMPPFLFYAFSLFLFFGFIIDTCVSYHITSSLKLISSEIKEDSTEKITKLVRKEVMKRNHALQKRLFSAFPKLKVLYSKGLERKRKRQKKFRQWKEKLIK